MRQLADRVARPGEESALMHVRRLLRSADPPDALFATSFHRFFPYLALLDEMGLAHPRDLLVASFDGPMEDWAADTLRRVIREPPLMVHQSAAEVGRIAVDVALAKINGTEVKEQERLVRPTLSWQEPTCEENATQERRASR